MKREEFFAVCRIELRQMVIAMAVGAGIGILFAAGKPQAHLGVMATGGALVGFCIYVFISALSIFFDRFIRLLPGRFRIYGDGTKYLIGGTAGWFIGIAFANLVLGGQPSFPALTAETRTFLLISAAIVLVVGLLFRSFEGMQRRLQAREWAERELEIARSIQTRLLPPSEVDGDGFHVAARCLPARYVAGDFYDIIWLDDGSVLLVVADVAGKGVGASLIMSSVKAVLPFLARTGVAETMRSLNVKLARELERRDFVALVCARYQPDTGRVEIANAGCPDPYLVTSNGVEVITCKGTRLPLGLRPDVDYTTAERTLDRGARLLLLSDGIPEAGEEHPLGYESLQQILDTLRSAPDRGSGWLDRLLKEVRSRVGPTLADDWTALLLERG